MATKKATESRTRVWTAVVYPESAPENWRDLLDEQHIAWVESPLHDQDVNPGTGELKKPHWHILLSFEGVKTFEQVSAILEPLGCPIPQRCHSTVGTVRYFAHLDNPEKHQYSPAEVVGHGGFDVASAMQPTSSRRYELIAEMVEFIQEKNVTEFMDLMIYAKNNRKEDWFPLLCDNSAYIVNQCIKSVRCRQSCAGN